MHSHCSASLNPCLVCVHHIQIDKENDTSSDHICLREATEETDVEILRVEKRTHCRLIEHTIQFQTSV